MGHIVFSKERGCSDCPQRGACSAPCDQLLTLLPSVDAGCRNRREVLSSDLSEPTRRLSRARAIGITRSEIDAMTGRKREVAERYYWLGETQAEIAKELHITERTVRNYVRKLSGFVQ